MASTDSRPVPQKNVAYRHYFDIRKNDGTLITSWTGADSEVSKDGGSFTDCTNEATEIGTSGCGYIDFTSTEMNADSTVYKLTVTNTGAMPVVICLFPEEAGDIRVNTTAISGTAQTARDIGAGVLLSSGTGTGQVKLSGGYVAPNWGDVGNPTTILALTGTTIATTQKVDVETIKTNPVVNGGTVTFPTGATLASTTNITAGTIATVTNTVSANVVSISGSTTAADNQEIVYATDFATAYNTTTDGWNVNATHWGGTAVASAYVRSNVMQINGIDDWVASLNSGLEYGLPVDSNQVYGAVQNAMGVYFGTSGPYTTDSGSTTTIVDADDLLAIDDIYNGFLVLIQSGPNAYQVRTVTDYNGTTKTLTIDPALPNAMASGNTFTLLAGVPFSSGGTPPTASAIADEVQTRTIAAVTTVTNLTNLPTIPANWLTAAGLATDAVAEIADQVWDEVLSGHLTAGTTGNALNAAGAAGDPWSTSLPGAYGAGTAGKIIGDNINAAIDSRMATYTQPTGFLAATFPGTVASTTNITAGTITTTTNLTNLPAITANWLTAAGLATDAVIEIQSGLASQSSVDTLAGYVDTEVAAIKAKTDNLPASPAATGDIPSAATISTQVASDLQTAHGSGAWTTADVSGLATAANLATVAGYLDTEIAAILADTNELQTNQGNWLTATSVTVSDKTGFSLTPGTGLGNQTANITGTVSGNSTHDAAAVYTAFGTGANLTALTTATGFSTHSAADVVTALGTGTTLTALPWNTNWNAEVQSECVDALREAPPVDGANVGKFSVQYFAMAAFNFVRTGSALSVKSEDGTAQDTITLAEDDTLGPVGSIGGGV